MFSKLFSRRIIANCILLAFILMIALSSCTSPRSVGYNLKSKKKSNISKNSTTDSIKPNLTSNSTSNEEQKFTNYESSSKNDGTNYISGNRLPTLREQMQVISEKQEVIENDISEIKNELTNIKAELVQIKYNLNVQGKVIDSPITTGEDSPKQITKSIDKIAMEETFFESDEVIGTNTPEVKKVTTNPKPKKKIRKAQPQKTESTEKTEINTDTKPEAVVTPTEANQIPTTDTKVLTQEESQARLAEDLINQGKIDDAKKIYKNIIKDNPKSAMVPIAKKKLQQL